MNIVVIGGVAGGMSAAARARRLDEHANIIVLEKGPYVSFANCGLPYYVAGEITDRDQLLLHTPASLKKILNLDVRVNAEVIAIDRQQKRVRVAGPDGEYHLDYDSLIYSPGASAATPPITGLDHPAAHWLRTIDEMDGILARMRAVGDKLRATVVGAGFIGLEAVEALVHRGAEVTLVEFAPHVLPPLEAEQAELVQRELRARGVQVKVGTAVKAITDVDGTAQLALSDGSHLMADLVVLSTGVTPNTELGADAGLQIGERGALVVDGYLRTNDPAIYAMGDAAQMRQQVGDHALLGPVPLAASANRHGRRAADVIVRGVEGSADQVANADAPPRVLGTAIVRVFGLTAAMTGANRRMLDALEVDYITAILHPADHAGYYPGAEQMHIVAHFAKADGALLGAQIVGGNGVANRINVFATALKGGLGANDLADLDLAYAPPFGSAKDPVNMTAFVAQNILDNTMPVWYANDVEQVLDQALILDVRSARECEDGMLPGALNIAHTQVRDHLDEIREAAAGRWIAVVCASGVRSYLATRILRGNDLDARNLAGGTLTLDATRPDWREL
ncbi:MAG: FAD-dependent oxidoreductase [Bowdeniella nasicola]|nr:FAD-dependent oxidoreductase [Bowdeniella nasicola]